MASVAERRRRRALQRMGTGPVPAAIDRPERPKWLDDPRELARRLPSFQALEAVGAISREQREAGDRFAKRYRVAVEHAPALTASYGAGRSGGSVDERAQHAARRWVAWALRTAGPAAGLLQSLARDERPRLTAEALGPLKAALEAI